MEQVELVKKESKTVISSEAILDHWQGHRRLTRKLIEVFPEKELFTLSVAGMRPFSEMIIEMLDMAVPGVLGIVTGEWQTLNDMAHINGTEKPSSKKALLEQWDQTTEKLNALWPQIPEERFGQQDVAFGQYEGTIISFILYFIDNEVHHRGQGYVYLRSLGIEPPAFWDRY